MIQGAPLAIIVALLPAVCKGTCELATLLPLTNHTWTIGSDDVYDFMEEQRCTWILPTINFLGDVLYLYVYPFDFRYDNRCVGDLALGDRRLCSSAEPECVLFTTDMTNIDFSHIQSQVGYTENPCKTWRIENRNLREVSIRTFDAVGNVSFKILYQFIKPRENVNIATVHTVEEETDWTELKKHKPCRSDPVCTECTGYIIALAVTSVFLCFALVILAKCTHMQSLLTGKRQPRVRGSFFQTESIDDDVDEKALRSPVPLATPKSPERKGNTSCFFQSLEEEKEEESKTSSGYVKAEPIAETGGSTDKQPDFLVDQNGESYYDIPRSTPAYAQVRKINKATAPKTEG